jgi:hypothetical protein
MTDIIETIDGALDDWTVSDDAMRWTPDPEEPTKSLAVEVYALDALHNIDLTSSAVRMRLFSGPVPDEGWTEIGYTREGGIL